MRSYPIQAHVSPEDEAVATELDIIAATLEDLALSPLATARRIRHGASRIRHLSFYLQREWRNRPCEFQVKFQLDPVPPFDPLPGVMF